MHRLINSKKVENCNCMKNTCVGVGGVGVQCGGVGVRGVVVLVLVCDVWVLLCEDSDVGVLCCVCWCAMVGIVGVGVQCVGVGVGVGVGVSHRPHPNPTSSQRVSIQNAFVSTLRSSPFAPATHPHVQDIRTSCGYTRKAFWIDTR